MWPKNGAGTQWSGLRCADAAQAWHKKIRTRVGRGVAPPQALGRAKPPRAAGQARRLDQTLQNSGAEAAVAGPCGRPSAGKTGSDPTPPRWLDRRERVVRRSTTPSSAARRWCKLQSAASARLAPKPAHATPWVPAHPAAQGTAPAIPPRGGAACPACGAGWRTSVSRACSQPAWSQAWLRASRLVLRLACRAWNGPWRQVCPCQQALPWPPAFSARPCSRHPWHS